MGGWMDGGWMHRWADGWMDGWMDGGWIHRWVDSGLIDE